jgi:hypothetical protein
MRKAILVVTLAAATAAVGISVAATASTTNKTEHFSFIDTSNTAQVFSAIATGAFTGGGTYDSNGSGASTMHLFGGTIKLQGHATEPPETNTNRTTCLVTEHSAGTYTLLGGTGIYKGISGSGKYAQSARQVGPTPNGKCSFTSGNPVGSQQVITASGPLSLP